MDTYIPTYVSCHGYIYSYLLMLNVIADKVHISAPYLEKRMRVKFNGGREASGVLKGYDALLNLVLDGATEYLKGIFIFTSILTHLNPTLTHPLPHSIS